MIQDLACTKRCEIGENDDDHGSDPANAVEQVPVSKSEPKQETLADGCNVISAPSKWKSLIKPVMPLITAGVGDALMLFASYRNMRHLRAPRACRTMSRDVEIGASRRKEAQLLTATVTLSITEFEHRSHCLQRASQRGDLCSVSDTCIEAGVRAIAVSVSC